MTTDIAVAIDEPTGLAAWAQGAREVHALAEHVAQSALVPQAYRGKPVDVLACWLTGQEVGIPPMAALRSIDVIQGTPSLRAHAMRALVQSRGHDIEIIESDDQHCVMRGRRKGSEWQPPVTWDLDRARRLGLLEKDQWKKQPRTMLIARATGEVCRLIASDVLFAVPYSSEELDDDRPPIVTTAQVDRPRTVADIVNRHTDEEQPWPATSPTPPELTTDLRTRDEPTSTSPTRAASETRPSGSITAAQQKMLHALLRDTDRGDRDVALVYISGVLGREITSTKELSKGDASKVIDALTVEANEPQPELDVDG